MKNRRERGIAAESDKNSDTGKPGDLNRLRGSFFPGGSLFQHRLTGAHELRQRVRPFWAAACFSAPADRGARTAAGVIAPNGRGGFR